MYRGTTLFYKSNLITLSFLAFISLALASGLFSCKGRSRKNRHNGISFSYDEFAEKLKTGLPQPDSASLKAFASVHNNMQQAYAQYDFDPIWLEHGYKAAGDVDRIIRELEETVWDGLDTSKYQITHIKKLRDKLKQSKPTVEDAIAFDTTLTRSFMLASSHLLLGSLLPKKSDSLWFYANDSTWSIVRDLSDSLRKDVTLEHYRSKFPTYKLLLADYKRYSQLGADSVLLGAINFINRHPTGSTGYYDAVVTILQKKTPWLVNDPEEMQDSLLRAAISAYQSYMGITPNGRVDSVTATSLATLPGETAKLIAANMERLRWMVQDPGKTYIIVDVPLMELYFKRDDTVAMHMRVVVGKSTRQTPALRANMANIVVNPPWGVPPTILKKDVLPGITTKGGAYLAKKGLKAYDSKGNRVSASAINENNYRRYQYRQDPGDNNALGNIKFNLPNKWDIYLHDTPHREDFVKNFRTLSSGCIRLHHPKELALYIFNEMEGKKYTEGKLDTIIDTHKTQWSILKNKIPVHITYLTAFEDSTGQHVRYLRDIYSRDARLIAAIDQRK